MKKKSAGPQDHGTNEMNENHSKKSQGKLVGTNQWSVPSNDEPVLYLKGDDYTAGTLRYR
jgi:hypothetical protein